MSDIPVQCTRCRNKHQESERTSNPRARRSTSGIQMYYRCCPRCGCKTYYDLSPQVAWCWATGLIEIGDVLPADKADGSGAIEIAQGPKANLKARISALARHGQGASAGKLLVPGVPEADGQKAKAEALATWLAWCAKRKSRDGVTFSRRLDAP